MNWIITVAAWIAAVYFVTRQSIKIRLLGIVLFVISGLLLGMGEYNRGRMHGRLESSVQLGSAVVTNIASAVQSSLEMLIKSNRIDQSHVSAENRAAFSNALERASQP